METEENSKEIFIKTLNLEKAARYPAAPHWWGIYKYEIDELDFRKAAWQEGEKLADIYIDFYEEFKSDWFHLHIGTPAYFKNSEIINRGGKNFLVIDTSLRDLKKQDRYFSVESEKDEEIVDFPDYLLGSRSFKSKVDLSSRKSIEEFIRRYVYMSSDEISNLGYADHVKIISKKYGGTVFINVHIPSAICEIFDPITGYTGFENGLLAFNDFPDGMRYLLERCYQSQLEWAKAFASAGAHGFAISEAYISPDVANPQIYRKFIKDIHRDYFADVKKMGLMPILYFTGDINPILEDLAEINISGLMVEESKKNFHLDVTRIKKIIGDRVCIFGNLDAIYLLHDGTPEDVEKEVLKQFKNSKCNFITCNGSPVTPGTPPENVKTLIRAGRKLV
ncbi:MAG: uroporphyrinogen decarboxylase family protein [Chitinophagaceae bacterium]